MQLQKVKSGQSTYWGIHCNTFGEWPFEAFVAGDYVATEVSSEAQPNELRLARVISATSGKISLVGGPVSEARIPLKT
jgi:hypothetical protein